jgi:hypothetical protein
MRRFIFAVRGGLYEFATADFFNDASPKPLAHQFPNTDFPDQLAERKTPGS